MGLFSKLHKSSQDAQDPVPATAPGAVTHQQQHTSSGPHSSAGDWSEKYDNTAELQHWEAGKEKLNQAARVSAQARAAYQQGDNELAQAERKKGLAEQAARKKQELEQHAHGLLIPNANRDSLQTTAEQAKRDADGKAREAEAARVNIREAQEQVAHHTQHHASLQPGLKHHEHEAAALGAKLDSAHRATADAEKHYTLSAEQIAAIKHNITLKENQVTKLQGVYNPLFQEVSDLELRLAEARKRMDAAAQDLDTAKQELWAADEKLSPSHQKQLEAEEAALERSRAREVELERRANEAARRAHEHSRKVATAADMARRAREQHHKVATSTGPVLKEVEEHRRRADTAQAELWRAEEDARLAREQHARLLEEASKPAQRAAQLDQEAMQHAEAYRQLHGKAESDIERKERLWAEAKNDGDSGISTYKEKVHKLEERVQNLMSKAGDKMTPNKEASVESSQVAK